MTGTTYAFLCGADMNPAAIRQRADLETARFVAIAATSAPEATTTIDAAWEGEVWGIVLALPAPTSPTTATAAEIPVTLRDGTQRTATLLTTRDDAGDIAATLVQARYWELPVPYRDRLNRAGQPGTA